MDLIEKNTMLEKVKRGEFAIGCQIRSRAPHIAELIGYCGFDYLFVDTEHYTSCHETVENMVRCAQLTGTVPYIRIPDHDPGRILQYLDVGAMGMILPHVDTGEQARKIVDAGKYAPRGKRGCGLSSRAAKFGFVQRDSYMEIANNNTVLIAMIESKTAVENLADILKSGVDMILLGPTDLSVSYGFGGNHDNSEELGRITEYIIGLCREAGVPVGSTAGSPQEAYEQKRQGFNFTTYSSDLAVLSRVLKSELKEVRRLTAEGA